MIELPPLPDPLTEPRYMKLLAEAWPHGDPAPLRVYQQIFEQEIAEQMRSYGEACARTALEAASLKCLTLMSGITDDPRCKAFDDACRDCSGAISALKDKP